MSEETNVDFYCTSEDHRPNGGPKVPGTLTIYERRWSFCPAESPTTPHVWSATGGIPLASLRNFGRHVLIVAA